MTKRDHNGAFCWRDREREKNGRKMEIAVPPLKFIPQQSLKIKGKNR